ncbi:MAG: hypothetical protein WD079_01145, partial [Phycisphaeraceae bacterium]
PGLTASLNRDEFVDMVSFLTKLGTDGDFNIGPEQVARRWRYLAETDDANETVVEHGVAGIVANAEQHAWLPVYSRVSGNLALDSLPAIGDADRHQQRFRILRFDLNVTASGEIELALNAAHGVRLWVSGEPVTLESARVKLDLPRGIHPVILAVSRQERPGGDVRVTIHEPDASPGRAQVVDGP